MGRRRRKNGLDSSDLHFMVTTRIGSALAAVLGIAGMAFYHLLEPDRGDPRNPIATMGHIFWEATAVRFYWPFVALFVVGGACFAVLSIRSELEK